MNNEGRILRLRASYFTKWLYFTSTVDGPEDPNAAPIFDDRIVWWLEAGRALGPRQKRCPKHAK